MVQDKLAEWRKPKPVSESFQRKPYVPYQEVHGVSIRRLWVKGGTVQADVMPSYGYLRNMTTDTWSRIGLDFAIPMVVDIRGERLGVLAEAIAAERVQWLEVYDTTFHLPPEDKDAPIIRSIDINLKPPPPEPDRSQMN